MIVVDASVLAAALADDGVDGDLARGRLAPESLATPELIDLEVASVIRRQLRTGALAARRARLALGDLAALPLQRASHRSLVARCWELRDELTIHAASYAALAELLGAPLVTADAALSRAPGLRCEVELCRVPESGSQSRGTALMRAAIITISTSVSRGGRDDASGELLAELAAAAGAEVVAREAIADDRELIEERLRAHVGDAIELVLTTGGTGFTPDDVTPEATRAVIERDAPGFSEAMRAEALRRTPHGILTRGASGIADRTLIVNFPGNPKAVRELFDVIAPALPHAVALLTGRGGHAARH